MLVLVRVKWRRNRGVKTYSVLHGLLLFFFLKLYLCYIYDTSLFLVLSVLGNSKALTYQYPLLEVLSVLTEEEE